MSEKNMRKKVLDALKSLHAIPVENPIIPGTPDINYNKGWIELKRIIRWPRNMSRIVKIPHYTEKQKIWAKKRIKSGGLVFLLLLVEESNDWLLFDGLTAIEYLGQSSGFVLLSKTLHHWNGFDRQGLLNSFI